MSEIDTRTVPSRGRSSVRGGRGGTSRGGPRGGRKVNGTSTEAATLEESLEDQGEIGQMKKKYQPELTMLKDMFPDWTDTDLVFALEEADGDVGATVDKITQGAVSQFAEVKKPKDRARSKVPAESTAAGATDRPHFSARGARGRGGFEGARGGRGRGADRGRGGFRGSRGGHATTNGVDKDANGSTSVPTTESNAWDTTATSEATAAWDNTPAEPVKESVDTGDNVLGTVTAVDPAPAASTQPAKSSVIEQGSAKKSWASMFAKPKPAPAPVPQKQILTRQPPPVELDATEQAVPEPAEAAVEPVHETFEQPEPPAEAAGPSEPQAVEPAATPETATAPVKLPMILDSQALLLTSSQDPLTEENVEHLPDESHAPATQTVASTAGSMDSRNLTPLHPPQAPIGRPPVGGYATVAARLAGAGGRSASYQRRVQEQQEAVVMPGHNAVDRAAVQFGSMGLNGEAGPDVDEEREEPETRHAPQHSPPAQPRTSLPPAARAAQESLLPEAQPQAPAQAQPTPKQAPGLPPASVQNQQQIQDPSLGQPPSQDQQYPQSYNQYARGYVQPQSLPGGQQDNVAQQQKPYDPFSHQAQQSQYDQYGHSQQQHQPQPQHQSGFGGLSSAPGDYSSYYTSDAPRNNYQQYYGGSYGAGQDSRQQAGQSQPHDPTIGQQRSTSGYGANENAFASHGHQQAQSRFAEAPGSGHNTPNPVAASQQQPSQTAQSQHSLPQQQQGHGQQHFPNAAAAAAAGYPYGHPYYSSAYPTAYANQFNGYTQAYGAGSGYSAGQGGYQGKQQPQQQQSQQGNSYGAPHSYGSSYDQHSASPANVHAYGQNQRSASGMGASLGGLDDYGRSSAQAGSHQQSSAFGSVHDPFARSTSGFGAQGGYGQQSIGGQEDSLKAYDNAKSGPSPALGQPGRPGSAANSAAGNAQSGLPPPQHGQHSGFGGGYPGFQGQGNPYNGLGGLGGHQQAQQSQQGQQSGQYGYGGFNQTYGSYGQSRGGWAQNYGAH